MSMEMHRNADVLFQRLYQLIGRQRLEQTGHILDGEDVRSHLLQLFRHADIVFERILVPLRIGNVAGITDGGLADLAALSDCLHGDLHAGRPVERVKDAEDVHAGVGGLFNELLHHVVRVVGIADRVRAAQQHLEEDIRDQLGKLVQPLPRILLEKTQGDVEGCSSPALQGEEVGAEIGGRFGNFQQVVGPDPGGKVGLMGVAHGGVGNEELFLLQNPL